MSQYTIISKYGKPRRQFKFKKELKIFPQETMENIELLENATPGSIKKASKYGVKIFQGKNLKTFFFLTVSQSKTAMQVEGIYTFNC